MKINSIIDLVKDLDTSRQTKNLNKLLIRILLHLQVEFSKEREDGKQEIEIELNPGHVLYQGHFPGQPVVPGVCTLQIIKESAEQIASQPLQYVQIASSKFLSAINPLKTPLLQMFIRLEKTEEHLFKLQAEGICNGKEFIKLKAVLMASKYQ